MTYTGKIQGGVVVFEGDIKPREGTVVRVEEVDDPIASEANPAKTGSIWDDLKELSGTAQGLPEDMATNHDHYIHGADKRIP